MKKNTLVLLLGAIVVYLAYKQYSKKGQSIKQTSPGDELEITNTGLIAPVHLNTDSQIQNVQIAPLSSGVLVKGDMAGAIYNGPEIWNDNDTAIVLRRGDAFQGKYDENGSILFAYVTEYGDRTRLIPPEYLTDIVKLY